jgi:alpha-L-rhamnosidase
MMTLGSEATVVRDVVVEDCTVMNVTNVANLKLRPDTPQHYEDIHFRNITLDSSKGAIVSIRPWSQYADLKGEAPPKSIVRNISLAGIKGRFGAFGSIQPNPGQTEISDIALKDFDVQLSQDQLQVSGATNIRFEQVMVNGKLYHS